MQFLEGGGGGGAFAPNAPSWIRHCTFDSIAACLAADSDSMGKYYIFSIGIIKKTDILMCELISITTQHTNTL